MGIYPTFSDKPMFESLKGKFDVFVAWICPIFTLGMCFCQGLSSEEKIVMSTFAKGTVNSVNAVCCSNVKASAGNTQNKQTCEYSELESERTNNRWGYDLIIVVYLGYRYIIVYIYICIRYVLVYQSHIYVLDMYMYINPIYMY